jgi:hypothetical protein
MALAEAPRAKSGPKGHARPRLAPPLPLRSLYKAAVAEAAEIGIDFMPWQVTSQRYVEAVGADGRWLYPEVAEVVARQNGKTEKLVPHIRRRLLMGRRIMHTAQNRELPREVFSRVAELMVEHHSDLLKSEPRFANGQEEIKLLNGGRYRIVAPTRGGARGPSNDDLIIDEVRELETFDFIAAAKPTLTASPNPQTLYLSNAGDEDSIVLNALRMRASTDPALAYLEWSASPDRSSDDIVGWCEANPSIGHLESTLRNLEREYRSNTLGGTLAVFETEHLCRWVVTMRERLVDEFAWARCAVNELPAPRRPFMAVSMDPKGERAAAAIAWQQEEKIGLQLLFDVTGHPIDTARLGKDMRETAVRMGVGKVGFDPLSDAELAKFFKKTEPISGQKYANASALFVTAVRANRLAVAGAEAITDDLTWTARKATEGTGAYQAVRASDDHPIPAALAAIRAVWLASGPQMGQARIY